MDHQDIEQFFSQAKSIRLSERAKTSGRSALLTRMEPAAKQRRRETRALWFGHSWFRAGAFASVLLLVGGTAWAAEGALPGDTLYAWKTRVNEPTRLAFLPTPAARADWSVELISRRLSEAEKLASTGRLDDQAQEFLEEKLNEERERADAYSQSAGDEHCDEIETEIKTRIESVQYVEVREDAGRLRIRVREEHEEHESEEEKRRENEVRHEDGWIEEEELHEGQHREDVGDRERDDEFSEVSTSKRVIEKKDSEKKSSEKKSESGSSSEGQSSSSASGSTKSSDDHEDDANDVNEDENDDLISESAARSKALAAVSGTVKESELKNEDDDPEWEVKIKRSSDGEEVKVIVDARSGTIEKIED